MSINDEFLESNPEAPGFGFRTIGPYGDKRGPKRAWQVRLDVHSNFIAGNGVQIGHHMDMDVESEFKVRNIETNWNGQNEDALGGPPSKFLRQSRHFYVNLDVTSDFIPGSGEGDVG